MRSLREKGKYKREVGAERRAEYKELHIWKLGRGVDSNRDSKGAARDRESRRCSIKDAM